MTKMCFVVICLATYSSVQTAVSTTDVNTGSSGCMSRLIIHKYLLRDGEYAPSPHPVLVPQKALGRLTFTDEVRSPRGAGA